MAQLLAEDQRPPSSVWEETLVASRLLEYELWTRLNARKLVDSQVVCVKFCKKESGMLRNVGKLFGRHRESAYVAGRRCRCEQLPG